MVAERTQTIAPDQWELYELMLRSRLFEEVVAEFWRAGLISGEMHLGMGEEAIVAGIVSQLEDGDALALDHRGTPPMLMRGVDLILLLRELLGHPDGLCSGWGGHMHLFSPEHLAASSGIVGASGPAAAGFALAAQHLRPGTVAVAFFGEGAMNQGMLMESFNLAGVWKLPVLFVCKDNGWAISTESPSVISGNLLERARSFGLKAVTVNGLDVVAVWNVAQEALQRSRAGNGPSFIHATCTHLEGHFLGDQLLRAGRQPIKEMAPLVGPMLKAFARRRGAPLSQRIDSLLTISTLSNRVTASQTRDHPDPLRLARQPLLAEDPQRLETLEGRVADDIKHSVAEALQSETEEMEHG